MSIRPAQPADIPAIRAVIDQAKAHLKKLGVDQWQNGYPDLQCIAADVAAGSGYLLEQQGAVAAYACISFLPEPAYRAIRGHWLADGPYAVVHRLAVAADCRGQGLSGQLLAFAQQLCLKKQVYSIRIDTDQNNAAMQRLLKKHGYHHCGVIQFAGCDKTAFQKCFPAP